MPYYAFTNLNEDNATYTGFRMVEADWELGENETLVEVDSLEGYTEATPPLSLEQKRLMLIETFKGLPIDTRVKFRAVAVNVDTALKLGDLELALFNLEEAKLTTGADVELLQSMIQLLEG